jgi:Ribbon-helix-helix protein, copG family
MARPRSISAKPKKRGRGRPATGRDPMIGLRLPKDEIARLDKWAKANACTRSEAIRVLIERGREKDAKPTVWRRVGIVGPVRRGFD